MSDNNKEGNAFEGNETALPRSPENEQEVHQEMECRPGGQDGIPHERGICSAKKCKIFGMISSARTFILSTWWWMCRIREFLFRRHSQFRLMDYFMTKIWGAVPTTMVDDLSEFLGVELLSYERENTSNFERQSSSAKVLKDALAVVKTDSVHSKMMKFEPLLEASGERNIKDINSVLTKRRWTPK